MAINSKPGGVDIAAAELLTLGFTGLEIEDESDLTELLAEHKRRWDYVDDELRAAMSGVCRIKLYITDDEAGIVRLNEIKACLKKVKESAGGTVGGLDITTRSLKESDWAEEWKRFYKPLYIGKRVLICPVWEEITGETDRIVFVNDPGMSFGTGDHESTRMCIEALDKYVITGECILDLGCGSGILFIIALLLGAGEATAVDIESDAAKTAGHNAKLNSVSENCYRVFSGDFTEDEKLISLIGDRKYDIITANIVADVIITAASAVYGLLSDNGIFISSGIISQRCDEVRSALIKEGFIIREDVEDNGWCCIVCTK